MKKGTFTSVWDGGFEVTTAAELDEETGYINAEIADVEDYDLEILDREYFTDSEENEYEVCSECHEHIMVTRMFECVGKTLEEGLICSNPYCPSNWE